VDHEQGDRADLSIGQAVSSPPVPKQRPDLLERINRFIDELGAKGDAGQPPYVPPMCGGVDALALSVSRDPGPKAGRTQGSGFLSIENDDPSAERMGRSYAMTWFG
jgi:hypothetical protein